MLIEFLRYFTSVVGFLSGVSLAFPYANELADVLTVHESVRDAAPVIASIGCAFILLLLYAVGSHRRTDATMPMRFTEFILYAFFVGVCGFVATLVWGERTDVSILWYMMTFMSFTAAFASIAVGLYFRGDHE